MIRTATIQDCHSVYSLICEMEDCKLDYETFEKIFAKMISCTDSYAILVAEKDNEVVGEITLRFEEQLHHCAKIAEIMECAVRADVRSCGIGSLLLEDAYKLAVNKNCVQIEVTSNQARLRAHKFYERWGMKNTHFKLCKPIL